MNHDEFNKFIKESEKIIALDFDGVIHNDSFGYHDGTIYGKPLDGSVESIKELSKKYTLIIYSCKSNPNRPLVNGKSGTELIWQWLEKFGINENISDVVWGKPNALIYIDDKGFKFENWNDTIQTIKNL